MFTGVRDYVKYLKRGFSRVTHLTTLDIKHGRMSRDRAMKLISKYEGKKPKSLKVFLEYLGINEQEFNDIVLKHIIPPFKGVDPKKLPEGEYLWDQNLWFKES